MKILVVLFLFVPLMAISQVDTLSAIDKFFLSAPGTMIKSEYVDVTTTKNVAVRLYKLTNQKNNQSFYYTQIVSGAQVDVLNEDIVELIDALSKLQVASQQPPTDRHEKFTYFLKHTLGLSMHESSGLSSGWVVDIGERYYHLNSFKAGRVITIRGTALAELIDGLKKAQTMKY